MKDTSMGFFTQICLQVTKIYHERNCTHLNVSAWLLPVSAVLDGFVLESKLNVFGLSECGDAVVEFAIQILESDSCVGIVVAVLVVELELFGWPHNERVVAVLFGWLTCPSAIAIGLGDESGDEVSDDTLNVKSDSRFNLSKKNGMRRTHLWNLNFLLNLHTWIRCRVTWLCQR